MAASITTTPPSPLKATSIRIHLYGAQTKRIKEDLIEQYNLCILNNGQGTHIKHRGGLSPIDLSLASNNLALKCNWRVASNSLGSDHYSILISIDEPPVRDEVDVTKYSFRKADWGRFKSHCKSLSLESVSNENLEQYCSNLISSIHAADSSIPKTRGSLRTKPVPYWNRECDEAVKNRKAAEKEMLRTKELDDQAKYREMKDKAQRVIKQAQQDYCEGYCNTLTNDSKSSSVRKMAKRMSGTNSHYGVPNLTEYDQMVEN